MVIFITCLQILSDIKNKKTFIDILIARKYVYPYFYIKVCTFAGTVARVLLFVEYYTMRLKGREDFSLFQY